MKCPIDQTVLTMTERQGIEIDYCPTCRGIWLDRGELDKLIAAGSSSNAPSPSPQTYREDRSQKYDEREYKGDHYFKKKKKDSFLGDLFDF